MSSAASERRLAENQVVFRSFNESVQKGIDEVNAMASEEGVLPMAFDEDALLHFFCECSNEKCRQRIRISPKAYNKIHKSRDTFIMVHGHEVEGIEDVTIAENGYCVVKKRKNPPKSATRLHPTDINNP